VNRTEDGVVRHDVIELPPVNGQRLPPVGHAFYLDGRLTTYTHIVLGESGRMLQITQYGEDGAPTHLTTVPYPERTRPAPFSPAASWPEGSQTFRGGVAAFCSKVLATVLPKPLIAKQGDEECTDESIALAIAYVQLTGASGIMAAACDPLTPPVNPVLCGAATVLWAAAIANVWWRQRLFDDCEAEQQPSAPDQPQVAGGEEPEAVEDNCELWGVYISYDGGYSWALMFTYWLCS
jgi:hypothetical protein